MELLHQLVRCVVFEHLTARYQVHPSSASHCPRANLGGCARGQIQRAEIARAVDIERVNVKRI